MLGSGARVGSGVKLIGNVVIGAGAVVEPGCELKDTVLWPSAKVSEGSKLDAAIVASCGVVNVFEHPKSVRPEQDVAKTQAQHRVGACV
jgi:NDP-sugar pyrophosphorylase family protein